MPKITFKDVFHNTGDVRIFRGDMFCPQTTQELPKKHHEVGPHEQLAYCMMHYLKSITDTLDTVKIAERFAYASERRKEHFGKSEKGSAYG